MKSSPPRHSCELSDLDKLCFSCPLPNCIPGHPECIRRIALAAPAPKKRKKRKRHGRAKKAAGN